MKTSGIPVMLAKLGCCLHERKCKYDSRHAQANRGYDRKIQTSILDGTEYLGGAKGYQEKDGVVMRIERESGGKCKSDERQRAF